MGDISEKIEGLKKRQEKIKEMVAQRGLKSSIPLAS